MRYVVGVAVLVLSACSTGVKVRYETNNRFVQPRSGPVCILPGTLPDGVQYEPIATILASFKRNGSKDRVAPVLANKARELGADAVLNVETQMIFRSPLPWAAVTPRGNGLAVRTLPGPQTFDCIGIGGILL